jgi:hypothetical protein
LGYDFHEQFAAKIIKVKEGERSYASFPPVDLTPRGVQHDSK